jgi:hypothetical protein
MMNAAVERVTPIKGTLNDAEVKSLIVRAARARGLSELHGIIKLFALNRVALVQVIDALRKEVTEKAKSKSATSNFDLALYEQLRVMRDELESAKGENESLASQNSDLGNLLTIAERDKDIAQRLAERTQRELLMANMDRERLSQTNEVLVAELEQKTIALQLVSEQLAQTRERLERIEREFAATMSVATEACAEREALRVRLSTATSDFEQLHAEFAKKDDAVKTLQADVARLLTERAEERKESEMLKAERMTQILDLIKTVNLNQAPQVAAAPSSTANIVAFSNRAEIDKMREQIRSLEATIANKDQKDAQLTAVHTATKSRLSDVEAQLQQREATLRSQAIGSEAAAKRLLEILPADQREIFASTSYDASSLMLIADAVKRHQEDQIAAQHYQSGIGHSM